jgi:protein phosphatase
MSKLGAKIFRLRSILVGQPDWQFDGDTHPGKMRKNNEDLWRVCRPKILRGQRAYATIIADGMGGPEAGEVAVAIACDTIEQRWDALDDDQLSPDWPVDWGIATLRAANDAIKEWQETPEGRVSAGTTGTLVVYIGDTVHTFHVGDSPAIEVRSRRIRQFTRNHNEVGLQGEPGISIPPMEHVLVYALGQSSFWHERYDHNQVSVRIGQIVLTATDGMILNVGMRRLKTILTRRGFRRKTRDLFDALVLAFASDEVAVRFHCRDLLSRIRGELMAAYLATKADDNGTFTLARYSRYPLRKGPNEMSI